MIICQLCNHENPEEATVCEGCTQPLPHMIPCPQCGEQRPDNSPYCGNCGAPMNQASVVQPQPAPQPTPAAPQPPQPDPASSPPPTEVQQIRAWLIHEGTGQKIDLPSAAYIRMGRPGGMEPPDVDVSAFPESGVASRVHAAISIEPDGRMYLEDRGSSNGTFVDFKQLSPGSKHLLQEGNQIALGKENKLVFIFRRSE